MPIENLPLFNAMNKEEVHPVFPNPKRPLTAQESHFAIMEKVRACISEVNRFEQAIRLELDNYFDKTDTENLAFKEAIQSSYNTFLATIQKEVNDFETDMSQNYQLHLNDFDTRIADFQNAINNEFATLQENVVNASDGKIQEMNRLKITLNEIVDNFKTQVTQHMTEQDEKIEAYKNHMVDNLPASVEIVLNKKAESGEIKEIMSDLYGSARTFKGALSYEEIMAVANPENGDYYYCTSDSHYYQRTETTWVDIGNGERLADDYEAFKVNTNENIEGIDARIDSLVTSVNLFDNRKVTKGVFLNYGSDGTFAFEDGFVSDYMKVKPDTRYHVNHTGTEKVVQEYDANLNFIKKASGYSFVTSTETSYIRFSTLISELDETMVLEQNWSDVYIPYSEGLEWSKITHTPNFPESFPTYKVISNNIAFTNNALVGWYLYDGVGALKEFADYTTSDYIPVKPNRTYACSKMEQLVIYDKHKLFISKHTNPATIVVPENGCFVRVSALNNRFDFIQINEGEVLKAFDKFAYTFENLSTGDVVKHERFLTLGEAWNHWANGEKFPVGILGDSTTDGASTSGWTSENRHEAVDTANGSFGSVDYVCRTAYPYLLEQLIQKELNNKTARIYNMGYTGFSFATLKSKYDQIFSDVYSDVKMVGIALGINDRIESGATELQYYQDVRNNLTFTIDYLYSKEIQPFIITSQATLEPSCDTTVGNHPLRTSEAINSIANRVKREVAEEYGLELIDMTSFGEMIMTYSDHDIKDILTDDLHFKDLGHKLESEFLFSEFCPRTVKVKPETILSFTSQRVKSDCSSHLTSYFSAPVKRFKVGLNCDKDNTDLLIQDFVVINEGTKPLTLKAHCISANTQYVIVDGESIAITETEQVVKSLDVGVHTIKAYSGTTTNLNWLGFTFE